MYNVCVNIDIQRRYIKVLKSAYLTINSWYEWYAFTRSRIMSYLKWHRIHVKNIGTSLPLFKISCFIHLCALIHTPAHGEKIFKAHHLYGVESKYLIVESKFKLESNNHLLEPHGVLGSLRYSINYSTMCRGQISYLKRMQRIKKKIIWIHKVHFITVGQDAMKSKIIIVI